MSEPVPPSRINAAGEGFSVTINKVSNTVALTLHTEDMLWLLNAGIKQIETPANTSRLNINVGKRRKKILETVRAVWMESV